MKIEVRPGTQLHSRLVSEGFRVKKESYDVEDHHLEHFRKSVARCFPHMTFGEQEQEAQVCALTHPDHAHVKRLNEPETVTFEHHKKHINWHRVVIGALGLLLILLCSVRAYCQKTKSDINVIKWQSGGTPIGSVAGPFTVNFTGAGVSCAKVASVVTCTVTGGSITNNPGGSGGQVQYNSAGAAFGGISTMTTDGTIVTAKVGTNWLFVDPTDTTKKAQLDSSGISTATTRIYKFPNIGGDTFVVASNLGTSGQPCLSNADGSCTFADPITSGNQAAATAQTITATGALSGITVTNIGQVLVTVSGTYAGVAFNFEATPDGTFTPAFPVNATAADGSSVVTATGTLASNATKSWLVDVAGHTKFRVNATAYTSGTANITVTPIYFQYTPWTTVTNTAFTANIGTTNGLGLDSSLTTIDTDVKSNVTLHAGANVIGKVGIDQTTPGTTNGVQINAALPAGTNVIGHVINDSGSTTAVTGNVAVTKADGSDVTLGAKADAKSTATDTTAVSAMQVLKEISAMEQAPASRAVTNAGTFATQATLQSGSAIVGKVTTDQTTHGTTDLVAADITKYNGSAVGTANPVIIREGDGTNLVTLDPCRVNANSFAKISQTTNTQVITGTSAKKTYICAINLVTAGANNVAIVEGTGTVCATGIAGVSTGGTTAATGWNFAANDGLTQGNGMGSVMAANNANADNVCILQSAAVQLSGVIAYVQQ